jgi:hypothetical protein
MIQRIQSLFLLLISLLSFLFLGSSYLNFVDNNGSIISITFIAVIKSSSVQSVEPIAKAWPVAIILILIVLISIITIFLYKNRKSQLLLSKLLIGVISVLILVSAYYSYIVIIKYSSALVPGAKMFLPLLMLILSILAFRGIKKDDQLVKSNDRLR